MSYFFNVFSEEKRKIVFENLKHYGVNVVDNCREYFRDRKFEEKWFKGKISSLDYLMLINKYASRSFNDTSQYPIMPWIGPCGVEELGEISEQPLVRRDTRRIKPDTKNKNNPLVSKKDRKLMESGHIRDLTKISGKLFLLTFIAILNETKAQKADHTYNTGPEPMERDIYGDERYNHKFGYMNSQICLSYLIRVEPYSSLFIIYNGKLDHPDRMLSDSLNSWRKVLSSDQCNSELIPEWFYLPQMFINNNLCFFGTDSKNKVVNDVSLPRWANENPFYYCMKFREFMENPRYSKILHYWIELVFGRKQQNLEEKNIYFCFATESYYEKTDEEDIPPMATNSAAEFFQLPKQLFTNNHKALGARDQSDSAEEINKNMIVSNADGVEEVNKEEIKITKDKDICNISFKKSDNPYRYMSVLTGNLK